MSLLEFDRSVAAFHGGMVVGTAGAYTFQLTVPGGRALPAAGVTWVAVLPRTAAGGAERHDALSAGRRGARGEPLAILWASESVIYPRFGYGRGMWHADLTIRRGEGVLAGTVGPADPSLRLRIAEPAAALPEMAKVYDAVLPSRPGFVARSETRWQGRSSTRPSGGTARPVALHAGRGRQRPARLRALLRRCTTGTPRRPCPPPCSTCGRLVAADPAAPWRCGHATCSAGT